ncbi:unnamed protein product [Adineta steineri]|uniref:Uncharacterized protein n=1 Tax=Adineta steineri TaxID=433720 RepID=A0A815BDU4_9BILA|nr:unnamed protein product [Adineta steineri]CAF1315381.1 unnamed protein product [Adineta steineri]CAF1582299.1 unnamed protein product [Adineta steineri]CAF1593116.1 unnamed protein product [Adineta steineri]
MSHHKAMFYLFLILVTMKICYGGGAFNCAKYGKPCGTAKECCGFDYEPKCVLCYPRYLFFGTKICGRPKHDPPGGKSCHREDRRYGCGGDGYRCGRK